MFVMTKSSKYGIHYKQQRDAQRISQVQSIPHPLAQRLLGLAFCRGLDLGCRGLVNFFSIPKTVFQLPSDLYLLRCSWNRDAGDWLLRTSYRESASRSRRKCTSS